MSRTAPAAPRPDLRLYLREIYEIPAVVALDAKVRGRPKDPVGSDENNRQQADDSVRPRVALASSQVTAHFAPVFGACLAAIEASRQDALGLALFMALRGVTSAAVRLGVVGPHEAQRLQRRQGATLDAVLAECAGLSPGDVATPSPLLDIMQATHDRLYARLFQS